MSVPPEEQRRLRKNGEKRCNKCLQARPLDEFHRNRQADNPNGRHSLCKECRAGHHLDPSPDTYEGAHRAYQDREERRYGLEGPSYEERWNLGDRD